MVFALCLHTPVITLPAGGVPIPSADDITGMHLAFWGRCSVLLSGGPTGSPALCSKAGHAVQGGCQRPRHPGCRTRPRPQTPGPGAQQPPRCWPSLTARCRGAAGPVATSPASQELRGQGQVLLSSDKVFVQHHMHTEQRGKLLCSQQANDISSVITVKQEAGVLNGRLICYCGCIHAGPAADLGGRHHAQQTVQHMQPGATMLARLERLQRLHKPGGKYCIPEQAPPDCLHHKKSSLWCLCVDCLFIRLY